MTETLDLFVGAILLIACGLAFWIALPRDGKVRSFLRNDHVQAYYAVGVVSLLVGGVVSVIQTGCRPITNVKAKMREAS
jgi:hypothetical protein